MDKRDLEILRQLQTDGRLTNAELAKRIHTAEAPAWRRVRALEKAGVITGYRATLDQRKVGYDVTAFVRARFSSHDPDVQTEFERHVVTVPHVVWCHNISGRDDYLLCVVAPSLSEYGELVSKTLRSLPGVTSIESSFSLKAVKSDGTLPIP